MTKKILKQVKKNYKKTKNFLWNEKYLTLMNRKEKYQNYNIVFLFLLSFAGGYLFNTLLFQPGVITDLNEHASQILSAQTEAGMAQENQDKYVAVAIKAENPEHLESLVTQLYEETVEPTPVEQQPAQTALIPGLVAGVGGNSEKTEPTATPSPTSEPSPTNTPLPSATPTPTNVPIQPTATPEPPIPTLSPTAVPTPAITLAAKVSPTNTPNPAPTEPPEEVKPTKEKKQKDKKEATTEQIPAGQVKGVTTAVTWWQKITGYINLLNNLFFKHDD